MTIYERLRNTWIAAGIEVNDGATRDEIEEFEARHNVTLSRMFTDYLSVVAGMKDGEVDEEMMSFLSLNLMSDESGVSGRGAEWLMKDQQKRAARVSQRHSAPCRSQLGGKKRSPMPRIATRSA